MIRYRHQEKAGVPARRAALIGTAVNCLRSREQLSARRSAFWPEENPPKNIEEEET